MRNDNKVELKKQLKGGLIVLIIIIIFILIFIGLDKYFWWNESYGQFLEQVKILI